MAILKMFTADMPAPFSRMSIGSATYVTKSTTQKRTGSASMKMVPNALSKATLSIGGTATSMYAGFWLYCDVLPALSFYVRVWEGATTHAGLKITEIGTILIVREDTTLGTLTATIGAGQALFIEMYVSINDSTGAVTVKVDGVQDQALTSKDTKNGGSGYAQALVFTCGSQGGTWYVDDVTIADDWPGTGGIYTRWPTGAGATANWTASTGNAYECIDADTDGLGDMTDYIGDNTTSEAHDFAMGDLGFTATSIGAVEAVAFGTVPTGSASARVNVVSGGTTANGADTALDSSGVLMSSGLLLVDPNTSSAWASAAVDALLAGVESRA